MDGSFFLHMISILFNACSSDILNRAELALNYSKSLHQNLSLMRFVFCLSPKRCKIVFFVSKKIPNNAVMPQSSVVLIVLVTSLRNEYNRALLCHSIIWKFFGDKKTSKSLETEAPY